MNATFFNDLDPHSESNVLLAFHVDYDVRTILNHFKCLLDSRDPVKLREARALLDAIIPIIKNFTYENTKD